MPNFIHFGERSLAHLLEGDYLSGILFASQVDFSISALANLNDDVERLEAKLGAPLPKQDALATAVGGPLGLISWTR